MSQPIEFTPIGHVENEFDTPAPMDTISQVESHLVLDPGVVEGLTGLEPGHKILVLFYFHLADGCELLQHPRGDRSCPRRGVFALRSPHRPNPIGVSEAELLGIEGNLLRVKGLDAINGSPILDLKPA